VLQCASAARSYLSAALPSQSWMAEGLATS
jgi:hypothetical protein